MDINRLTEKAQEALRWAFDLASRNGQQQVEPEHLLLALLEQEGGVVPAVLAKAGVDDTGSRSTARRAAQRLPGVSGAGEPHLGGRLNRILLRAEDEARQLKDDFVAVEHLVLALLDDTGATGRLLRDAGLNRDRLLAGL